MPYQYTALDLQKINAVRSATLEWGKFLGVNLESKLPTAETLFFFKEEEFLQIAKADGYHEQAEAFSRPYFSESILKIHGDCLQRKELRNLNHEMVHLAAPFTYELDEAGLVYYKQTGFSWADNSFKIVDESITELSAYQIYINFWKHYPCLIEYTDKVESNSRLAYVEDSYLILLVLDKICAKTGKSFGEVLGLMQKSLLTNPQKGWDFLAANMEADKFESLKNIKEIGTFESNELMEQMLRKFLVFEDFMKNYNAVNFCIWDKMIISFDNF